MINRRRIDALEIRYHKPGACPACGGSEGVVSTIKVHRCGEGEPLGYYYEKPWPDYRPGERFPYPPDPRPVCPTCGGHVGPMLLLTAVYDADEWDALRKQAPAGGRADGQHAAMRRPPGCEGGKAQRPKR